MSENFQPSEAVTANTRRLSGFAVPAFQLNANLALLLALSIIPTRSGVAQIA